MSHHTQPFFFFNAFCNYQSTKSIGLEYIDLALSFWDLICHLPQCIPHREQRGQGMHHSILNTDQLVQSQQRRLHTL
jgi:hypothetical protein